MYKTSFVAQKRTRKDILKALKKVHDYVTDGKKQKHQQIPKYEDFEEKAKTKAELLSDAKMLSKMIRWVFVFLCCVWDLALFILLAVWALPPLQKIGFSISSAFSLFVLWFLLKIKNKKNFDRCLKFFMCLPPLLSLGTLSWKWVLGVWLLTVLNVLAIQGYLFLTGKFLIIKNSENREQLMAKIEFFSIILFALGYFFTGSN